MDKRKVTFKVVKNGEEPMFFDLIITTTFKNGDTISRLHGTYILFDMALHVGRGIVDYENSRPAYLFNPCEEEKQC